MQHPAQNPLKTPLLIACGLMLFFFAIGLLTWIALDRVKEHAYADIHKSLHTVLHTTHEGLHLWKNFRNRQILELAELPELITETEALLNTRAPHERQRAIAELRRLLGPVIVKNRDLGFFIIDRNRISRASMRDTNLDTLNLIARQRPLLLKRVFAGNALLIPTIFSDVPLSSDPVAEAELTPTLFFAAPIRNADQVIAVLTLRVDHNQHFSEITQLGRIGNSGETYAFDAQGTLLSRSRFEEQLRRIGLLQPRQQSTLNIRISDPGSNLLKGNQVPLPPEQRPLTLMVQTALRGQQNHNHTPYPDYRGVPVFGAWTWDQELGLGLATEIDAEEALQTYNQTRFIMLCLLSASVVLGLLMMAIMCWLMLRTTQALKQAHRFLELRVEERTAELAKAKEQLETANCRLQQQAHTDSLTGLANRREMDQLLAREWGHCRRQNWPFSIVLLDIDHFKGYNDHYGHQMGDKCLIKVANLFKELQITRRPGDLLARYGGEEFILILGQTDHDYALSVAEQLRRGVYELALPHAASEVASVVTVSIGVATVSDTRGLQPEELIQRADSALYLAKEQGRNQVCSYQDR